MQREGQTRKREKQLSRQQRNKDCFPTVLLKELINFLHLSLFSVPPHPQEMHPLTTPLLLDTAY